MKAPIVRAISPLGVIVSLLSLVPFLGINAWLAPRWLPLVGVLAWMIYVIAARQVLTGPHRKGMRLAKGGRFADAIPFFAASYEAMPQRPWIDRCRWLLLGGCSRLSYREMALCNQAFCYGQAGDREKMRSYYLMALTEFPGSMLATTALRMLDSIATKVQANKAVDPTPGSAPRDSGASSGG